MRARFLILTLLSLFLLVLPNGMYSAFDRDEPKYLSAGWEMLQRGDLVTPYYNYEYRFDKPILVYWTIIAGYRLFGVGEFGGRFFPSLAGVLCVLLLFWWLSRNRDPDTAFWTSLAFLSLLDFIVMASVAMPDVLLLLFITSSLVFFFEGYHRKKEGYYLLAFLSSGLAVLSKGPVGAVLPFLAASLYLVARREFRKTLKEIPWIKGLLLFTAVVFPWYTAVLLKHGYRFFKEFILFHNIHRFLSKVPGHPTQWWYYIANYPWLYLPWSVFFPFALCRLKKDKSFVTDELLTFCGVWFAVTVVFFQIAHTKLPHYLLPSFPAFAVITVHYLKNYRERFPLILTALLFLVLSAGAVVFFAVKGWNFLGLVPIVFVLAGTAIAIARDDPLKPIALGFLGAMITFKWVTLPVLESYRAKPSIGRQLSRLDGNVFFLNYSSPEIVFYYRRGKIEHIDFKEAEKILSSGNASSVYIVTRKNRLRYLKEIKYRIVMEKRELLANHSIVVISGAEEKGEN